MGKLVFINTQTVEQFKNEQMVSTLHVKENPKTGKLFFTYGSSVGAVSEGWESNPCISKVRGDEGEFYLLHKEGEGLQDIATL